MTERDEDVGVIYTTLWHGTLAGGITVDEDGGENGNEYDSRLSMEMRTRTILVGLWPSVPVRGAPPPGFGRCAR